MSLVSDFCGKVTDMVGAVQAAVKPRPCRTPAPFNVPWCFRRTGWPAGSVVYTNCGNFFTLEDTIMNPSDPKSPWIQFEWKILLEMLTRAWMGSDCSFTFMPGDIEGCTRPVEAGEVRCWPGGLACAKVKTVESPTTKSNEWSEVMSPSELICKLISIKPYVNKKGDVVGWGGCFVGCDEMGAALAWNPETGKFDVQVDNTTVKIVDNKLVAVMPEVAETCATPFQYRRVDAFFPEVPFGIDAPVQESETGVEFYNKTLTIPAALIRAGGVPECADLVEVVAVTNVAHDASPPGATGHLNIDSRVTVDGFTSRSFNNEAATEISDDHDYERNSGFARLNSDGSLDWEVRFRGNHPDGNGYATAVAGLKILGWGVQSVLNQ